MTVEQASYASVRDRGEQVARLLLGLNADNRATSLSKFRGLAAGDFADQVDALDKLVASLLKQGKGASRGKVFATAVEELNEGTATGLVASAAVVTNTELPQGELRTFRMAVHLRHTSTRLEGRQRGVPVMSDLARRGPSLLARALVAAAVAFNVVSWRQEDAADRRVASDREAALRITSQAVTQLLG